METRYECQDKPPHHDPPPPPPPREPEPEPETPAKPSVN